LLGVICLALLGLGAGPGLAPASNGSGKARPRQHLRAPPNAVPAAVWDAVDLRPEQKARLDALKADLQREQSAIIRAIAPTAAVLKREYDMARKTPGQEKLAQRLRLELLRLTAPLQRNQAAFVREGRLLLSAAQKQGLHLTGAQVKKALQQRPKAAEPGGAP
jgi:hypothetical protein